MKWFILFLFGVLSLAIYVVPSLHQKAVQLLSYSQCDAPLPYKLGTIDARFNLNSDDALNDIKQATDIWSNAEGKKLFIYSSNANLTVNFVYDQRQALDTQITDLNKKLKQNSQVLNQQITQYNSDVANFEQRLSSFKETVDKYNREGGAPPSIYDNLMKQQKELQAEGDALNERAKQLNLSTNDYNSHLSVLNQDVSQFNQALNQKPEEGVYESNKGINTITIYFASNQDELIHTLAHEFGHSLGMVHVGDPDGIMYEYTTSALTVTTDDRNQLDFACREQSLLMHWILEFDTWLVITIQNMKQ